MSWKKQSKIKFFLNRKNFYPSFWTTFFMSLMKFVIFPILLIKLISFNAWFNALYLHHFRWFWCMYFPVCTFMIYSDYAHKGYEECYMFAFYLLIKYIFTFMFSMFNNYF